MNVAWLPVFALRGGPWVLCLGVVLSSCTSRDERSARHAAEHRDGVTKFLARASQPGHMTFAADSVTLVFVPCGESGPRTIRDLPANDGVRLVRDLGGGPQGPAVMIRLESDRLVEIRYAAPEGSACERLPPAGDVEARGNEPFWYVGVTGADAIVRTPEELEGVAYRNGNWQRRNGGWRFEAGSGGSSLSLELTEERCTDTMSGAWYPFRAVLVRSGERVEGCALEGQGAQ